jgi:hypothetical protein
VLLDCRLDSTDVAAVFAVEERKKALKWIVRQANDHVALVLSPAFVDCYGRSRIFHWFLIQVESDKLSPPEIIHYQRDTISFPFFLPLSLLGVCTYLCRRGGSVRFSEYLSLALSGSCSLP